MKAKKVLFVCVHNSARSQMAEAYMNRLSGGRYLAESAGLERGTLNPYAVKVMAEDGIDISGNVTNSVFEYFKEGRIYHYVFRVCDEQAAERCPVFPDIIACINWTNFPNPTNFRGTEEEIIEKNRLIRDEIKTKISEWLETH